MRVNELLKKIDVSLNLFQQLGILAGVSILSQDEQLSDYKGKKDYGITSINGIGYV